MAGSSKARRSYYEVLGIVRTAKAEEVEAAFRKMARKWHPDVCPDPHEAAANFKLIAEAYEVLGDPEKRRRYDAAEARRRQGSLPVTYRRASGRGRAAAFRRGGASVGSGEWPPGVEPFFTASRPAPPPPPKRRSELDVEADLPLMPEEARRGGAVQFRLAFGQMCPTCAGEGTAVGEPCDTCGGTGKIRQGPRIVDVHVPPGLRTGAVLRVPGEGKTPSDAGPPGDLLLRVQVRPCW